MSETFDTAVTDPEAPTSENPDPGEASAPRGEHSGSRTTLVSGATGFLGRHLVAALAGSLDCLAPSDSTVQREVHVLSSGPDPVFEGVEPAAITAHQVDLHDAPAVTELMNRLRADELFHLAWFNGESASRYDDPANHDWVAIAEHLADSFARAGGRRAVVAGSCIEYGPHGGVLSEDGPVDPDTVYGRCKLDAGQRALAVADDFPDLTVAVARIFFALGRYEEPNRLVPHIIRQLLEGQPAELSAGSQRRDYMHAWDVARGLIAIADSSIEGYVNLGMGQSVSVKELSEIIGDSVGRPDLLWFGARAGGADTAEEITADTSRLSAETGWKPSLDLEAASADVVKWWTKQLDQ
jgi:nucleoside-diphosphate-sugar epimerase